LPIFWRQPKPNKVIGPPESRADDDGSSLADFEIQIS
jgi:hypothetical protein